MPDTISGDQFGRVFNQMDAMDAEHPHPAASSGPADKFFHGTTHNVTGGKVLPADVADKNVSEYSMGDPGDMSEGDHAFAIKNDERYAWHAAGSFHKNGRRPRVYEVEPAADMTPGPWNKENPDFLHNAELYHPDFEPDQEEIDEHHQDEWASRSGFQVKSRLDIMPGRQGTFPGENWNKFKDPKQMRPAYGPDANHPSDTQIKYGLDGLSADDVHGQALAENDLVNAERTSRAAPGRRSGTALRAAMTEDWRSDPAPHSELREMAGRPQKQWDTLF